MPDWRKFDAISCPGYDILGARTRACLQALAIGILVYTLYVCVCARVCVFGMCVCVFACVCAYFVSCSSSPTTTTSHPYHRKSLPSRLLRHLSSSSSWAYYYWHICIFFAHVCIFLHVTDDHCTTILLPPYRKYLAFRLCTTAYCIWSIISPISKLNRLSSSLRLFRHVQLKRDELDWEWRMRLNDTPNAIGCTMGRLRLVGSLKL